VKRLPKGYIRSVCLKAIAFWYKRFKKNFKSNPLVEGYIFKNKKITEMGHILFFLRKRDVSLFLLNW